MTAYIKILNTVTLSEIGFWEKSVLWWEGSEEGEEGGNVSSELTDAGEENLPLLLGSLAALIIKLTQDRLTGEKQI